LAICGEESELMKAGFGKWAAIGIVFLILGAVITMFGTGNARMTGRAGDESDWNDPELAYGGVGVMFLSLVFIAIGWVICRIRVYLRSRKVEYDLSGNHYRRRQ